MLEAVETLKARSDFLLVQGKGKKWISQGLVLQVRENDLGLIRIGYTVTKKTDKSAVNRNRIKRRMRAVAAEILPLQAKGGCDYILVGRPATATRPFDQLLRDVVWCLKKMGYHAQGQGKEE